MWSQNLLLDLLDFKADLLAVGRLEQEGLDLLPRLQREHIPLIARGTEGIDKPTEEVASIKLNLRRFSDLCDLIEDANADLTEGLVDFL